jgi:hypothetical protein
MHGVHGPAYGVVHWLENVSTPPWRHGYLLAARQRDAVIFGMDGRLVRPSQQNHFLASMDAAVAREIKIFILSGRGRI